KIASEGSIYAMILIFRRNPSMRRAALVCSLLGLCAGGAVLSGCGDEDFGGASQKAPAPRPDNNQTGGDGWYEPDAGRGYGDAAADDDDFVPEQEEFLVREVATTAAHVFVPNSAQGSHTVALIDGRDFSIRPIPVGAEPVAVRAATVDGVGDIA